MNPPPPNLSTLVDQAEDARDRGQLAMALALAESAWAACSTAADALRLRVGLLLQNLRYRSGALTAAMQLADELLPLLRASAPVGELIDNLRMVALLASDTDRFAQSLACAQEAHRLSLEADDPVRLALTTNALGCFFERVGDAWQAERLMFESLTLARRSGDPHALRVGLNNTSAALIGSFYLLRDAVPLDEAREPLRRALPLVDESAALAGSGDDDFFKVIAFGNLGEIQVHLGCAERARPLLDEALALALKQGYRAQVWRLGCSLGEWLLLTQQPQPAWDQLARVLAEAGPSDQRTTRRRLHHAMWRAASALGQPSDALQHLQDYVALDRLRSLTQMRAQSDLFVTRMEAEQARRESQRHREHARALEADLMHDQLTGLGNRRKLEASWPALIRAARDQGAPLSVAMLDLDHFKRVNDTHGHDVGDQVLRTLAELLRAQTREGDVVARTGGEEFLLVLPDTDAERAAEVCERLRLRVADHDWKALAPGLTITISIGLTSAPPADARTLSIRADDALYRAKAAGRNRLVQLDALPAKHEAPTCPPPERKLAAQASG
jgi:diguanylate cyclase (GGDEF)-like protein